MNEYPSQYTSLNLDVTKDSNPLLNNININSEATNYGVPNLNDKNNTNIINNTLPNTIGPGYLNSIKRIVQTHNLNLHSCFRSNYSNSNSSDFIYILPNEIKNVVSMRLASIEIPKSWYLFSCYNKNNTIKIQFNETGNESSSECNECVAYNDDCSICHDEIKEDDTIVSSTNSDYYCSYEIVIHDGNYDYISLQTYLNNTYFYNSNKTNNLKYIKFSIDPFSLKTKFELIENAPNNISFSLFFLCEDINQDIMTRSGWTLGFRKEQYLNFKEICSEAMFDAGDERYIYVSINDYQYNENNLNTVALNKSVLNEDVIAKIPMNNGKLSLIIDDSNNPLTKTRRYNGPVNISKLHIKLIDKFGYIIDLNNMDFSFTIELEILYESFNFKNVTA